MKNRLIEKGPSRKAHGERTGRGMAQTQNKLVSSWMGKVKSKMISLDEKDARADERDIVQANAQRGHHVKLQEMR